MHGGLYLLLLACNLPDPATDLPAHAWVPIESAGALRRSLALLPVASLQFTDLPEPDLSEPGLSFACLLTDPGSVGLVANEGGTDRCQNRGGLRAAGSCKRRRLLKV